MAAGTTSRTARLLAVMNKGDDGRPGQPGHCRGSVTRNGRPGLLTRLLARSLAVCADHATCVTPAHPVRQEAREGAQRDRGRWPRPLPRPQGLASQSPRGAVWLPGVRTVAEVGVGEAVVVLQARAEEPVQADVGEPDQGQGHE